ncbi:MAG: hypothetical protein ACXABY_09505, partial [Candidatus Thorarchaeota archaeon]
LFEILGGLAVGLSVHKLLRDKRVHGYHWGSAAFFTTWGAWNMWYYQSLSQSWSAGGAVVTFGVNVVYLGLIWRYRNAG